VIKDTPSRSGEALARATRMLPDAPSIRAELAMALLRAGPHRPDAEKEAERVAGGAPTGRKRRWWPEDRRASVASR